MGGSLIPEFEPASRLKPIKPSGIRRFFALGREIPECINLSVGEPGIYPPASALDIGWNNVRRDKISYTATNGIYELREELAQKARRKYGLNYDPNSEILVTVGGTEAVFLALLSLVDVDDEVLVPNPGFVVYAPGVFLAHGTPIYVPLLEKNGFKPSINDVRSLITDKSRVIILNYPNNPTGSVLSYEEAAAIAKMAVEHNLIVISDEVYEEITYGDAKHYCLAAFPGMRERTLVINSFSKTYAMTGLRIGYVYGPRELVSSLWLVHQYTVACVDSVAQNIALAALRGSQDFVANMVCRFNKQRLLVHERLNELEGVDCLLPKGAFYAFPNVKAFKKSSEELTRFIAREANVMTVPGSAFGCYGEGYLRLSYAAAGDELEEALNRIEKAIKKLKS